MSLAEWNKKEELVAEQALKHLQKFTPLFAAFTNTARSEMALMLKIQEYCYENMNFMKIFHKIILLFYKSKSSSVMINFLFYCSNLKTHHLKYTHTYTRCLLSKLIILSVTSS